VLNRYPLLAQLLGIAAAFIVVTTFAFGHPAANSIDFGVFIGITVISLIATAVAPGAKERVVSLGVALVGAWSILVTAGIFSGSTQRWLAFAGACAVAASAAGAQALYELARERRDAPVVGLSRAA
jgi:hypothetical protein